VAVLVPVDVVDTVAVRVFVLEVVAVAVDDGL